MHLTEKRQDKNELGETIVIFERDFCSYMNTHKG